MFSPKDKIEEIEYIPPIIKPMTNEDKFLKACLDGLDSDVSPDDLAKDEVGCAESISNLIKKVFPDFPIVLSTKDLDTKLFMDKRFKQAEIPNKGRIIISPRTPTKFGHVGVFITNERIASNDSRTGKFMGNYDWNSWINEFKYKRGLKIYLYDIL